MEKEVFDLEQKHLDKTYNKLLEMKKEIEELVICFIQMLLF